MYLQGYPVLHVHCWEDFVLFRFVTVFKFVRGIKEENLFGCKFWHTCLENLVLL